MFSEKSSVVPPTNPRIRILGYKDYVEETEEGLREILAKNGILKFSTFRHGKEFPIETGRGGEDPSSSLFM
jgi:hypothetical protein